MSKLGKTLLILTSLSVVGGLAAAHAAPANRPSAQPCAPRSSDPSRSEPGSRPNPTAPPPRSVLPQHPCAFFPLSQEERDRFLRSWTEIPR